ncbi:hypothetical protein ACIPEN_21990 [Herbaspirillum chlorophenolicum]|uniref:Uncharacterized protein n=1 Tax=Herbaspirillum chlorophenolicum TaxID=211589 RepID=A0ABW8F5D5_9BURK
MARKTATITIEADGRDKGKTFHLTEMSAARSEEWAERALLALVRGGVDVPDDVMSLGLAGIAVLGLKALQGLPWDLAKPLLEEMFTCVRRMPNPSKPNVIRDLVEDDIEEVKTRLQLRWEILKLHIDFFTDEALLTQARKAVAASQGSSNTPTSIGESPQ